jgi:hypothetical protein
MTVEISDRMHEALQTYVDEGDPQGIEDLGRVVADGNKPWFVEEFEADLKAGLFTREFWGTLLYNDEWTPEEEDWLQRDLRGIWAAVAPGRPFPLDTGSN